MDMEEVRFWLESAFLLVVFGYRQQQEPGTMDSLPSYIRVKEVHPFSCSFPSHTCPRNIDGFATQRFFGRSKHVSIQICVPDDLYLLGLDSGKPREHSFDVASCWVGRGRRGLDHPLEIDCYGNEVLVGGEVGNILLQLRPGERNGVDNGSVLKYKLPSCGSGYSGSWRRRAKNWTLGDCGEEVFKRFVADLLADAENGCW